MDWASTCWNVRTQDTRNFIQTGLAKKIPVTPVLDMPKPSSRNVLKEGGLGIHVLRNVLHRGQVELHPYLPCQEDPD